MSNTEPFHKHHCDKCQYIRSDSIVTDGRLKRVDFYICTDKEHPILARYGEEEYNFFCWHLLNLMTSPGEIANRARFLLAYAGNIRIEL